MVITATTCRPQGSPKHTENRSSLAILFFFFFFFFLCVIGGGQKWQDKLGECPDQQLNQARANPFPRVSAPPARLHTATKSEALCPLLSDMNPQPQAPLREEDGG